MLQHRKVECCLRIISCRASEIKVIVCCGTSRMCQPHIDQHINGKHSRYESRPDATLLIIAATRRHNGDRHATANSAADVNWHQQFEEYVLLPGITSAEIPAGRCQLRRYLAGRDTSPLSFRECRSAFRYRDAPLSPTRMVATKIPGRKAATVRALFLRASVRYCYLAMVTGNIDAKCGNF